MSNPTPSDQLSTYGNFQASKAVPSTKNQVVKWLIVRSNYSLKLPCYSYRALTLNGEPCWPLCCETIFSSFIPIDMEMDSEFIRENLAIRL